MAKAKKPQMQRPYTMAGSNAYVLLLTDDGNDSKEARELLTQQDVKFEEWPAKMFANVNPIPYLLSSLVECGGLNQIKSYLADLARFYRATSR